MFLDIVNDMLYEAREFCVYVKSVREGWQLDAYDCGWIPSIQFHSEKELLAACEQGERNYPGIGIVGHLVPLI